MEEQRQAMPRIATNIEITFQNAGASVCSSIVNLSSVGSFIIADNPLPIDSPLSLWFRLPGDPEIMDIKGRVVWIKQSSNAYPAGMGIQFIEISPAHQEKIQSFVEAHRAPAS